MKAKGGVRRRYESSDSDDDEKRRCCCSAAAAAAAAAQPAVTPASRLPPPAAASPPSTSGDAALDAAIHAAHLALRRSLNSNKLRRALTESDGESCVRTIGAQLHADVTQPESLIDWSRTLDGDESCLLFTLLERVWECLPDASKPARVKKRRRTAVEELLNQGSVLPLDLNLLRSFDPPTVDAQTGNNALHQAFEQFTAPNSSEWDYKLIQLLIARGVSVDARNNKGRTPLLTAAACFWPAERSAVGIRLLLSHGADLNAQDSDGDGILHYFARKGALDVLEDLLSGEGAIHVDFLLVNSAGQTAADLAAIQLAEKPNSVPARQLHQLLLSQQSLWMLHVRPLVQQCVEEALIPDLAALVLAYVEGSGLPFAAAAAKEDSDDHPPASASAAAAAAASS